MVHYTVCWLPSARSKLAQIWIAAPDRRGVTHAANRIDLVLKFVSRLRGNDSTGVYGLTVHPLRVTYTVSVDDRKVTVVRVEYVGQH